jgi:protein FLOWERING LOCUS T
MSRDPLIVGGIVGTVVDYFDASARLRVLYSNREITNGSELRPSTASGTQFAGTKKCRQRH